MIFFCELKKLAGSTLMIGLVALCIGLNAVIVLASNHPPYMDSSEKVNLVNVFENVRTNELAEGYIRKYGITGTGADLLREKYGKLQSVVDEKAKNGDALSFYFGESTPYLHSLLFKTLLQAMTAEICLLALLGALLSTTYEQMRKTDSLVYASKTGRTVQLPKLYAALTVSAVFALTLFSTGLLIFFARFDFSEAWSANVSSAFNRAVDELKPFMTWNSLTVAEYLAAAIGLSIGLALCFCLLGYTVGIGFRHAYAAFGAGLSIIACLFLCAFLFSAGSVLRGVWNLNPLWLWKNIGLWFTDGGADILWPSFEILGFCVSLPVLAVCARAAFTLLQRRELH